MSETDGSNEPAEGDPRLGKTYDVTREIRRLALEGRLTERFPQQASVLLEALCEDRRVWFSEEYQDYSPDTNRRRTRASRRGMSAIGDDELNR